MDYSDIINGIFESAGCFFVLFNIRRVLKDKKVQGVSAWAVSYFTLWGFWNFWYYSNLDQWFSFTGGATIALTNLVWVILLIYYIRKERNDKYSIS